MYSSVNYVPKATSKTAPCRAFKKPTCITYLCGHPTRTPLVEREVIGVEHPVVSGVGEAANQIGAGGGTVGTLNGRKGTRDDGGVVVRGPFEGPSVFAWFRWAVG